MTIKLKLQLSSFLIASLFALISVLAVLQADRIAVISIAAGAVLISLGVSFFVGSAISDGLSELLKCMQAVEKGDFKQKLRIRGSDDIAKLGLGFNKMADNIEKLISEVEHKERLAAMEAEKAREATLKAEEARKKAEMSRCEGMLGTAETLDKAMNKIKRALDLVTEDSEQIGRGAKDQMLLMEKTVAGMEQVNTSVLDVASNAGRASAQAEQTRAKAEEGAEVVKKAISSIEAVNSGASELKDNLADLGSQAEAIGKIMNVISDIADQTNLLALNAAIEAARAGEAGRGFAVVADEVRKLAEKTMNATREVGQAVTAIQDVSRKNITGMEKATQAVEEATSLAADSGKSLVEIVNLVSITSDQIRSIAAAAEQQSSAVSEINRAIADVSNISHETVEGIERSVEAIDGLGGEITSLADLNKVFRLIGQGKVQALIMELSATPQVTSLDRNSMERKLREVISLNSYLELLYATDEKGRQIIGNIAPASFRSAYDSTGYGEDWSNRPWFTGAIRNQDLFISDSYVSAASNELCITVSSPIWDKEHRMIGVIAADVRVG